MSYDAFQKQVRRDKRVARYEDVRTLFAQGLSQRAIARKLKLSRATVGKFVQAEAYPERHASKAGARRSLLDLYKGYLLQRWQQGCRNSVQLYDEITARGFKGSAPLLRKFLAELRQKHQQAGWMLPRWPSKFLLTCLPNPILPAVCLPHAPPGSLSAKQESWMRSKSSTLHRFELHTLTWRGRIT